MTSVKAKSRNYFMLIVLSLLLTNLWAVFPQSFEGGAIREGWTVYHLDGDGNQFNAHNAGTNAYEGNWIVRVNANSAGNDDWLITPALEISNTNRIVTFFAKSNNATFPEDFNIKLSTTTNAASAFTVNLAQHTSIPNTWTKYTADLSTYVGQTVYLGIQCVSVNKMQFQLDAFEWQTLYDLEAVSLAGPTAVFAGTQYTFTANIKNNGAFTESNYTVKLYDSNDNELVSVSGLSVDPTASVNVELNWTPQMTGAMSLYAKVFLTNDQVNSNDQTSNLNIMVYNPPAPAVSQVINSYATGQVINSNIAGGLGAVNTGTVTGCFWDITTTGQTNSAGGEGKTTAEMTDIVTYISSGWNIANGYNDDYLWNIYPETNNGYPNLTAFEPSRFNLTLFVTPVHAATVSGMQTFNESEIVIEADLNYTANTGWSFSGWTSDLAGTTPIIFPVTMPAADVSWYAQFEQIEYSVTLNVSPENSGEVSGAGVYHYEDTVTVTATANTGYTFIGWSLTEESRFKQAEQNITRNNREIISTNPEYIFEMPAHNKNLTANFEPTPYSLTLIANPEQAGAVSGIEIFNYQTILNETDLSYTANTGWSFSGWTSDLAGTTPIIFPVTMPAADVSWYAQFEQIEYSVTLNVSPENSGEVSGAGVYYYEDTVTVTATASEGYQFMYWTSEIENRDLASLENKLTTRKSKQRQREEVSTDSIYIFLMPAHNVTLTAHFEFVPVFNPLVNLTGEVLNDTVVLNWEIPENIPPFMNLTGYKVYRNNEEITDIIENNQYIDTNLVFGTLYTYFVTAVYIEPDGESNPSNELVVDYTSINENSLLPLVTKLNSAYPNPFNPSTTISFDIAEKAFVNLEIYNIKGQRVRTLVNTDVNPGSHRVVWNGLDENHRPVSSGVYFYKMQAGKYLQINKIVMMK